MGLNLSVELSYFRIIDLHVEHDDMLTMVALQCTRELGAELWGMQLRELCLSWSSNAGPQIIMDRLVDLPGLESAEPVRLASSVITDRYLYGVIGFRDKNDHYQRKLLVFDYKQGSVAVVVHELPLENYTLLCLDRRKLLTIWHEITNRWRMAEFDAVDPRTLTDSSRWEGQSITMPSYPSRWSDNFSNNQDMAGSSLSAAVDAMGTRSGWGALVSLQSAMWDLTRQVAYLSDALGVRAVRQADSGRWHVIGEYGASPLAMQFRWVRLATPRMLMFDGDLLLEYNDAGLMAYDISDPSRLRRVGFAMHRYQWHDPRIHATKTHLVLFASQWVHVIDRPQTK